VPVAAEPLLAVRDLRISFGSVPAVRGVSFEVSRGETLALVGESGSGKSVTAQAILGLLPPEARVEGDITFEGRDLRRLPQRELRRLRGSDVAIVFQDIASSLNPVRTIGTQLAEPLQVHLGLGRRAARARAAELLAQVGLPSPHEQLRAYPHQLSGGMRQRVMIAIAISCNPRLLLVDEATTALDVSVQAQILELLRKIAAETSLSMVVISHDLSVVAGIADRVAVMYAGELVEVGEVDPVFRLPQHPYTAGLLRSLPRADAPRQERLPSIRGSAADAAEAGDRCAFAPRCPLVMDVCRTRRPPLEPKATAQLAACFADVDARRDELGRAEEAVHGQQAAREDGVLLDVRDLRVHFPLGGLRVPGRPRRVVRAVDGVSFSVRTGETFALVGESGSGKSTVARAILRAERPTTGTIELEGRDIGRLSGGELRRLRRRFQLVSQDSDSALNPRRTVGAEVAEPLVVHRVVPRNRVAGRVQELLRLVGLAPRLAERYPFALSGGQRQRVNISRALAPEPVLVIADEPTAALDVSVRSQVINLLEDLKETQRLTYILITHDLSVVRHISDRVAVMYLGRIVEIGDSEEIFRDPRHPYTQALLAAIPVPDPSLERSRARAPIPGEIPSAIDPPPGCPFHTRCPLAFDRCTREPPPFLEVGDGHLAACFLADQTTQGGAR
jgi:peptide/nickel transport system ATP-binding protein